MLPLFKTAIRSTFTSIKHIFLPIFKAVNQSKMKLYFGIYIYIKT